MSALTTQHSAAAIRLHIFHKFSSQSALLHNNVIMCSITMSTIDVSHQMHQCFVFYFKGAIPNTNGLCSRKGIPQPGKRFTGHTISAHTVINRMRCIALCAQTSGCG